MIDKDENQNLKSPGSTAEHPMTREDRYNALRNSIFLSFLVFAMVTNVLGAVTPLVIEKYDLTLAEGGLLTLSFFIAFGIASIPAGLFVESHGKKTSMLLGIALMFVGALSFPLSNQFILLLLSTLIAGIGVTFIQVGANTLVEDISVAGSYVKNLNITHAIFGLGSFSAPLLVAFLLKNGYDWRLAYLLFVVLCVPLFFITLGAEAPRHIADLQLNLKAIRTKLLDRELMSFALGLFLYVGTEVGIATWLVLFLKNERGMSMETGMLALSLFWALLAIGRYFGGHLTHKFSPRGVLSLFSIGAITCLALGLVGPGTLAIFLIPVVGFFLSVMFPTMFSVAIENTLSNKGIASGILTSAIVGGAIIPYAMGLIGDAYGLAASFSILFLSLGYILLRALAIRKTKRIEFGREPVVIETV